MEVKICEECGVHNDINNYECESCGYDLTYTFATDLSKVDKEDNYDDNLDLKNKFRFLRQYTISISKNDMFVENNINYKKIDKYDLYYIYKEDYDINSGVIRSKNLMF